MFNRVDFVAIVDQSPLAAALGAAARAVLAAVLAAPLSVSMTDRLRGEDCKRLDDHMRRLKVDPAEIQRWLRGLSAGHDPEVVADLNVDGWTSTWDVLGGLGVTISPWGAERLGVELVEFGNPDDPETRWGLVDPEPRPIKLWSRI